MSAPLAIRIRDRDDDVHFLSIAMFCGHAPSRCVGIAGRLVQGARNSCETKFCTRFHGAEPQALDAAG